LDTETRDDEKTTSFPKSCIFIIWVNSIHPENENAAFRE